MARAVSRVHRCRLRHGLPVPIPPRTVYQEAHRVRHMKLRPILAWLLIAMFVIELGFAFKPPKDKTFAISAFARLPLLFNGRIQPMDSLARNSLLQIRNTLSVPLEGNDENGNWGQWNVLGGGRPSPHATTAGPGEDAEPG